MSSQILHGELFIKHKSSLSSLSADDKIITLFLSTDVGRLKALGMDRMESELGKIQKCAEAGAATIASHMASQLRLRCTNWLVTKNSLVTELSFCFVFKFRQFLQHSKVAKHVPTFG